MSSCDFCKITPTEAEQFKSCVCGKASYCSKECQAKDWKTHKPSCPPFIIRESPGKGRGLFATRKIKEGQIILEEYPLLTMPGKITPNEFLTKYFPKIDHEKKAKILKLHDRAEDLKKLDNKTFGELLSKNPLMIMWKKADSDTESRIFRIFCGNSRRICEEKDLYDPILMGLYDKMSLINHSCVPNVVWTWVMGDFQRQQVKAIMTIEKGEEILVNYRDTDEIVFGTREVRRQELLENFGFLCQCSECSLAGEALQDNEMVRTEIREKEAQVAKILRFEGSDPRSSVKLGLEVAQRRMELFQKLDLQDRMVVANLDFYLFAAAARAMGVSAPDPDVFKKEALKYAEMCGDFHIHRVNTTL